MNWDEVRRWRVRKRAELMACRRAVRPADTRLASSSIHALVRDMILDAAPSGAVIGGYWPIKGEINLAPLFRELDGKSYRVALPVVVEKNEPVEFWRWTDGMPMNRGIWNIPIPAKQDKIVPVILVVPLVGYDDRFFRLGNGGGYYDRTLAQFDEKPLCIGVGYSSTRVASIFPQNHDVPMDVIVTEEGLVDQDVQDSSAEGGQGSSTKLASSPCYMADGDPSYMGFLDTTESLNLVSSVLASVRAGAEAAMDIVIGGGNPLRAATYLDLVCGDIHACTLLRRTANRLKAEDRFDPDRAAPAASDDQAAVSADNDLYCLHEQTAQRIRTALPKVSDTRLYQDLTKVLRLQERALARLTEARQKSVSGRAQVKNAI